MVQPEPPAFLRVYQPHLRYYLVDEGRYTDEELAERPTPLSGVFGIENATGDRQALQRAVDRIVAIIQADPNMRRTDEIVTRWLKRHLQWLGTGFNLDRLNSVVEDKEMLAENLENWAKKERQQAWQQGHQQGHQEGHQEGISLGEQKARRETACNLIKTTKLDDATIAHATGLPQAEIAALRHELER